MVQRLHHVREVIVEPGDVAQGVGEARILDDGEHLLADGVVAGDADVVDGWEGGVVVFRVDADGVGEFEGGEGGEVRHEEVGQLGEEDGVNFEELERMGQ